MKTENIVVSWVDFFDRIYETLDINSRCQGGISSFPIVAACSTHNFIAVKLNCLEETSHMDSQLRLTFYSPMGTRLDCKSNSCVPRTQLNSFFQKHQSAANDVSFVPCSLFPFIIEARKNSTAIGN